ncbi:MAG: hypothetical protein GX083_05110 [Clostridiales bacterium]|nr:hypothetical protein [Clostridiales bacterium]
MKYGDKIIRMEGIIVNIKDGSVDMDLIGRIGFLSVPNRMMIADYPLKIGQKVAFNMSFIEQEGQEVNDKYFTNITIREQRIREKSRNIEEE